MHVGEMGLQRGVAELVDGARLSEHLPGESVLQQVQEMYPVSPLAGEDKFGHLHQGDLPGRERAREPGPERDHEPGCQAFR